MSAPSQCIARGTFIKIRSKLRAAFHYGFSTLPTTKKPRDSVSRGVYAKITHVKKKQQICKIMCKVRQFHRKNESEDQVFIGNRRDFHIFLFVRATLLQK